MPLYKRLDTVISDVPYYENFKGLSIARGGMLYVRTVHIARKFQVMTPLQP